MTGELHFQNGTERYLRDVRGHSIHGGLACDA